MVGLPRGTEIKTADQLCVMRRAGLIVDEVLTTITREAKAGMTTKDLDAIAAGIIASRGAHSPYLGYGTQWGMPPYPAVTCVSVNEAIVHGIPGDRVLVDGDLVSVDIALGVDGWFADAARSFAIGEISAEVAALSEATRKAMAVGVATARAGRKLGDVEHAIEASIEAEPIEYGIVEEYTGHGIGSAMHQPPDVFNYGKKGRGPKLVSGLALAIEPMVTLGDPANDTLADGWTVVTRDGSVAAHWENTVVITDKGLWILTEADGGEALLREHGAPFAPLAD
ncbi:MAG: type I methionyl aminopeptidase [Propionibacteriaceae bacterium]